MNPKRDSNTSYTSHLSTCTSSTHSYLAYHKLFKYNTFMSDVDNPIPTGADVLKALEQPPTPIIKTTEEVGLDEQLDQIETNEQGNPIIKVRPTTEIDPPQPTLVEGFSNVVYDLEHPNPEDPQDPFLVEMQDFVDSYIAGQGFNTDLTINFDLTGNQELRVSVLGGGNTNLVDAAKKALNNKLQDNNLPPLGENDPRFEDLENYTLDQLLTNLDVQGLRVQSISVQAREADENGEKQVVAEHVFKNQPTQPATESPTNPDNLPPTELTAGEYSPHQEVTINGHQFYLTPRGPALVIEGGDYPMYIGANAIDNYTDQFNPEEIAALKAANETFHQNFFATSDEDSINLTPK